MPWRDRFQGAFVAARKRHPDTEDMDDDHPWSSADTSAESCTPSSASDTADPRHPCPSANSADSQELSSKARESRQRSEFLQVFTGSSQQTGLNQQADPKSGQSTSVASATCVTRDSIGESCNESKTDSSAISSFQSDNTTGSCLDFPNSLTKNGANQECSHSPSESPFSADSAQEVEKENVRDSSDTRVSKSQDRKQQCLTDAQETKTNTSDSDVLSATLYPVGSSHSLADRIDRAQKYCSSMRSDIISLSARCDVLLTKLKTTRTHLTSIPQRRTSSTTDTVSSVSLTSHVKQISYVNCPPSSVPNTTCSGSSTALTVKPHSKCNGFVAVASPRSSLSILERVEEELSFRLDQLTAYVSSNKETKGEKETVRPPHLTTASSGSSGHESASHSAQLLTGKDPGRRSGGNSVTNSTSMLTPPMSDESSSVSEEDLDKRQWSEIQILNPVSSSLAGSADFFRASSPVLQGQFFESDCCTPDIQALTCLESFSDSGRLKPIIPIADEQSLQTSVMIHTPPLSDQSAESEHQSSCTDVKSNVPASQATQPAIITGPGQHRCYDSASSQCSSECSESDWRDNYTDSYWSCPSHLTDLQECDGAADGQEEKVHTIPVLQRGNWNAQSKDSTTSITVADSAAKTCLDEAGEDRTRFASYEPAQKVDLQSAMRQKMVHGLPSLQNGSQNQESNANSCKDETESCCKDETESCSELWVQGDQEAKFLQKSLNNLSPENNSIQDMDLDIVELKCTDSPESPKDLTERGDNNVSNSALSRPTLFAKAMLKTHFSTKKQQLATSGVANTMTGASVQITTKANLSEKAIFSTDRPDPDLGPCISSGPAGPQEQPFKGDGAAVTSTALSQSSQQQTLDRWKLHQKRSRQHRSARHLQHLSMAKAGGWPLSEVKERVNSTVDSSKSGMQPYTAVEGVSCGFNFLRQTSNGSILTWTDLDNNVFIPVNIVLAERNCFESTEAKSAPEHADLQAHNSTSNCTCPTSNIYTATNSASSKKSDANIHSQQSMSFGQFLSICDDSSVQLNRKGLVTMEELKTRIYVVAEMQSTEIGLCVKPCSSGVEKEKTHSKEFVTNTAKVWNKEHTRSGTEVTLSTCTKADEEIAAACIGKTLGRENSTVSNITYNIKDTQKQHVLSYIAEGESETVDEEDGAKSLHSRNNDLQQVTENTEEETESSSSKSVQSQISETQGGKEDFSLKNGFGSKIQEPPAVEEKHKLGQDSSSSQEYKATSDRPTDVQANFADVTFDNRLGLLNISAPAFNGRTCGMLTSTPVVSNQKLMSVWPKEGCVVHSFFNPNQSMDQSCIWEMTGNAHHTFHCSQAQPQCVSSLKTHNDNDVESKVVPVHLNVIDNFNSLGDTQKSPCLSDEDSDSTSVRSHCDVFQQALSDIQSRSTAPGTCLTRTGNGGQKEHHPQVRFAQTFVIAAAHIPENVDSVSVESSQLEKMSNPAAFAANATEECSYPKLGSNDGTDLGIQSSEPGEKMESHPEVLDGAEEKAAVVGTKATKTAEDVTDYLLMKPRPKPLLPTPPYRRSPLCGGIPPCPHCLNHELPGVLLFPAGQTPALSRPQCPQECQCGHGSRCVPAPFSQMFQAKWTSPVEMCGPWSRTYNGPVTTCSHHGGASRVLPPAQSAAVASGSTEKTLNLPNQAPHQRIPMLKNAVSSSAKSHSQHEPSANQDKTPQPGKLRTNPRDQPTTASVIKTSPDVLMAQPQAGETDQEVKEDVLPLLALTWTLLMSTLHTMMHSKDKDCPDGDRKMLAER